MNIYFRNIISIKSSFFYILTYFSNISKIVQLKGKNKLFKKPSGRLRRNIG